MKDKLTADLEVGRSEVWMSGSVNASDELSPPLRLAERRGISSCEVLFEGEWGVCGDAMEVELAGDKAFRELRS